MLNSNLADTWILFNIYLILTGDDSIKVLNKNLKINPKETDYYFVHSYFAKATTKTNVFSDSDYEINFTSAILKDNIFACQFHPEKSSKHGLQLLSNFINWSEKLTWSYILQ